MELNETTKMPWYTGIVQDETSLSKDIAVQVIDKGGSLEFVLPQGTAQFSEMSVRDTTGNLIWKTQTFNKNTIVWNKQTNIGKRVPIGRYTYRVKQGNRQVDGITLVA